MDSMTKALQALAFIVAALLLMSLLDAMDAEAVECFRQGQGKVFSVLKWRCV